MSLRNKELGGTVVAILKVWQKNINPISASTRCALAKAQVEDD